MTDDEDLVSKILESAQAISPYELEAMSPPRWSRTLLTVNRKCNYAGSLSVSLIEERPSAGAVAYSLACSQTFTCGSRELAVLLPRQTDASRIREGVRHLDSANDGWRCEVAVKEAEEIIGLLERTPVPATPQPISGCDGCMYELLIERRLNKTVFTW
jgi:hypothetical protein